VGMRTPMAEVLLSPWAAAYAVIGFILALATAAFLYRKGGGDLGTRFCSTLIALYVWATWPFMLALGIVVGLAYLLFTGSLRLIELAWQQAQTRWWWLGIRLRGVLRRQPRLTGPSRMPQQLLEEPQEEPLGPCRP
jgi:hypothetical protein